MNNEYKLSDEAIANIAKMVQIAILTGTDIVDNMRMMRLVGDGEGSLVLEEGFKKSFDENISSMLNAVENALEES